jgi:amidase
VLHDAALAMLATQPAHAPTRLVLAMDLVQLADIDVARATREAAEQLATILGATLEARDVSEGRADAWFASFRAHQLLEAWESHGAWITGRRPRFGPGIAARFEAASHADVAAARHTDDVRAEVRARLAALLGRDGALVVPSAATVAPPVDLDERHKADLRTRTMTMTCVAGLAGAPALSLPTAVTSGLPAGACLVALPGADEALLAAAVAW